jgi:hypothetical protein
VTEAQIVGPDGKPLPKCIIDPIQLFALKVAQWGAKTTTDALTDLLQRLRVDGDFRKYMLGGGPNTQMVAQASVHPEAVAGIERLTRQLCAFLSENITQAEVVVQEAVTVVRLLEMDGPLPADVTVALQGLRTRLEAYDIWKKGIETQTADVQKPTPPSSPTESTPKDSDS